MPLLPSYTAFLNDNIRVQVESSNILNLVGLNGPEYKPSAGLKFKV